MAHLRVDQVEADMVLAADLKDRRGRLIMPSGTTITARHLRSFKVWGVTQVEVGSEAAGSIIELEPWAVEAAEAELDELFRNTDRDHPFVEQLFHYCRHRRAEALQVDGTL